MLAEALAQRAAAEGVLAEAAAVAQAHALTQPTPTRLPATPAQSPAPSQHGLQRIEIDSTARTMTLRPMLPAPADATPYPNLWGDRSLQIEDKLVYLTQGRVGVADW